MKNVPCAMSTGDDVTNPTVIMFSVELLLELEFYVVNIDKRSDSNSERSQCNYIKYKHSWNTACPIKIVDQNELLYKIR